MKPLKILLVFLLVISLSGCSMLTDYRESEQMILVSAIGFDLKENALYISAETVSKADSSESIIITSAGLSAEECIENLKKTAGIPLLLSHCGAVVLGKTLGASQAEKILLELCRLYEFPLGSRVMASESALALLKCKSISGEQVGYGLMRQLKESDTDSRLFVLLRSTPAALPEFEVEEDNYILKDSLWKLN